MHMEAAHRVASLCVLGNVAFQLQRKLEWDAVNERVKNDDEANRMLSRPGRAGVASVRGIISMDATF